MSTARPGLHPATSATAGTIPQRGLSMFIMSGTGSDSKTHSSKSPSIPLFQRGTFSPLWQRGGRGDLKEGENMRKNCNNIGFYRCFSPLLTMLLAVLINIPSVEAKALNAVIYLNGPDKTPFNITLTISGIEAKKKEGLWVPLLTGPVTVNSIEMVDNQILLSELELPAGKYDRLRVRFSKATWVQDERTFELIYPEEGMDFNYSFQILEDDITPVFMTWEAERCIKSHIHLSPCFSFEGKAVHLPEVVGYVTSEASGAIYVIDRRRNNVILIIRVGPSPKGITANPDTNRAYVVNSGSDTVAIIDTRYSRVIYTLNLEMRSKSEAVTLADDGNKLYVTNSDTNSVSVIDASTYKMIRTIPVGIRPVFVVAEPRGKKVYVVNNYSHEVSVIDTSKDTVVGTIRVEQYPETAATDAT